MSRISARAGTVAFAVGGRAFARKDGRTVTLAEESEGVRLSDDGTAAAVWSKSDVRLVDVASGASVREWRTERPARKVRFVFDGSLLATERGGGVVLLPPEGPPRAVAAPPGLPLDALVADGGDRLIVCDRDEKIRVCRHPRVHEVVSFCLGHEEFVSSIEPVPHDRDLIASSSGDGTVRIWDPSVGAELLTLEIDRRDGRREPVERVVCGESGGSSLFAVSASGSTSAAVHRVEGDRRSTRSERIRRIDLGSEPIGLAADGEDLRALYSDGKIKGWNMLTGEPLPVIDVERVEIVRTEEEISHLYKRKVDNLREYRERKKRRLEGK